MLADPDESRQNALLLCSLYYGPCDLNVALGLIS